MKRILLTLTLFGSALVLWAADVQRDDQASISVRTRTEFDLSLGDLSRYGLTSSIPELAFYYNLTPWQKVGGKPRSVSPVGFIAFDMDAIQIRYTNGGLPDYNRPTDSGFGFGFNDPASTTKPKPGYFGPAYLPNMRSGITWGDWTLQLAAAGGYNFWNPWNHEFDYGNETISADWAMLDTRVQYRRGTVAQYLANRKEETNYWSYDTAVGFNDRLVSLLSSGPLIGLEYGGKGLALRGKVATRYTLASLPADTVQGLAFGFDASGTPIKPLTITGSLAGRLQYQDQTDPELLASGVRAAYSIPLVKGMELVPTLGYDVAFGLSGAQSLAQEAAVSVTLKWPGKEGWQTDYLRERTGAVFPGTTLAWKLFDANARSDADALIQDVRLSLFEDTGDEGLVKGLGAEWVLEVSDLGNHQDLSLSAYHDWTFAAGKAKYIPWVRTLWDNKDGTPNRTNALAIDGGLKIDQLIPKVLFGITWESGDLTGTDTKTRNGILRLFADITL